MQAIIDDMFDTLLYLNIPVLKKQINEHEFEEMHDFSNEEVIEYINKQILEIMN